MAHLLCGCACNHYVFESKDPDHDLHANQPSSSSRLVGAGRGAPGPSWVGSLTCPPAREPNGFRVWILSSNEVDEFAVLAGTSGSLRLQPSELIESRNDADAMILRSVGVERADRL